MSSYRRNESIVIKRHVAGAKIFLPLYEHILYIPIIYSFALNIYMYKKMSSTTNTTTMTYPTIAIPNPTPFIFSSFFYFNSMKRASIFFHSFSFLISPRSFPLNFGYMFAFSSTPINIL